MQAAAKIIEEEADDSTLQARSAAWQTLGRFVACESDAHSVTLDCGASHVRLTSIRNGIIRVRLAPGGRFGRDHSWAITPSADSPSRWSIAENTAGLVIDAGTLRIEVRRDPCRLSFHPTTAEKRRDSWSTLCVDEPARGMMWSADGVACWKSLAPDEHFFGFGEKGLPLDKRGQSLVNWNTDDYDHGPWSDPLYQSHPFLISVRMGHYPIRANSDQSREQWQTGPAYGLFFDNTFRTWFDLGKTSRHAFGFGADGGEMNYYVIPGPRVSDVLARYAALVGAAPLPPRWSLGYQQCRWSYESEKRIRDIARQFRRRKIPCDTLYLDIDYMDGYRCFTWNSKAFPRPAALMKSLADDGFSVVTIVDPGIKVDAKYGVYRDGAAGGHYCHLDGAPYVGKVWPGDAVFPDFTRPQTRQWWGRQYRALTDVGVRGFWNDMNEPADFTQTDKTPPLSMQFDNNGRATDQREAHNIYGMEMSHATFDGLVQARPDERPFVLTRAGYAGVQRFAAVWTGDNASSWEHCAMSIPMLLNLGLSGVAFCGADVGGFRGVCTPELYARWLQLGVFYPLFRTHTAGGPEQDPWSYGKKLEAVNRRTIELRYRLFPYIYTELDHATRSGEPLMRPLLLDFPDYPNAHKTQEEFLFGRQLFVAPVLTEGATSRAVRLPVGTWFDYPTSGSSATVRRVGTLEQEQVASVLTGRSVAAEHTIPVTLDAIPILARAGAIIPAWPVRQHTQVQSPETLTLDLFPGDGTGTFYDDDGLTFAYRTGSFVRESYEQRMTSRGRVFTLVSRSGDESFAPRRYLLQFHAAAASPKQVRLSGQSLKRLTSPLRGGAHASGWSFDRTRRIVQVWTDRLPTRATVEI